MKNSLNSGPALPLRALASHYASAERLAPDGSGIFWVTYLVGAGDELGAPGESSCSGYLVVCADGPYLAEAHAVVLLRARGAELGLNYTVTAVHSAAQLAYGLFALETVRAGLLAATPSPDFESWEEKLAWQWEGFIAER